MLQILADALEKHGAAVISAEKRIAVAVISVPVGAVTVAVALIAPTVAWTVAVSLIATVIGEATVFACARRSAIRAARRIVPGESECIF